MENISSVRHALENISDAFYEVDPEKSSRGPDEGVRTLWKDRREEEYDYKLGLDFSDESSSSYYEESIPQFDEVFEYGAAIDRNLIQDVMGGRAGDDIERSVQFRGIEALAWYVTFHVRGGQWGIYIPLSSVAFMVARVFNSVTADLEDLFRLSVRALHQHELFHFALDYVSGQVEILTKRACHKPSRSLKNQELGYIVREELIANANMIRSFWGRRLRGKTEALRNFVAMQPLGHKDALRKTETSAFKRECDKLVGEYVQAVGEHGDRILAGLDGLNLLPDLPIDWRYCPVNFIADELRCGLDVRWLDLFRRVEAISESNRFQKKLKGMPKSVKKAWDKVKSQLAWSTVGAGLDFKYWERTPDGPIYSVRLTRSHRAHLLRNQKTSEWTALAVGPHSAMGHG
jgi:hypothetical protein